MMRIITGTARGVRLNTLEGTETRPTAERVKEAVFSMLQFDIEGRCVLDLFSGSGQMALEALSRGADEAILVDRLTVEVDASAETVISLSLRLKYQSESSLNLLSEVRISLLSGSFFSNSPANLKTS